MNKRQKQVIQSQLNDERATLKLYPGGVIEYSSVNKASGLNLTGSSKLTGNNSYFLSITGISRIINSIIPLAGNMDRSFKIRLTDLQSESVEVSEYKFILGKLYRVVIYYQP